MAFFARQNKLKAAGGGRFSTTPCGRQQVGKLDGAGWS
jgi:hypothetical protein